MSRKRKATDAYVPERVAPLIVPPWSQAVVTEMLNSRAFTNHFPGIGGMTDKQTMMTFIAAFRRDRRHPENFLTQAHLAKYNQAKDRERANRERQERAEDLARKRREREQQEENDDQSIEGKCKRITKYPNNHRPERFVDLDVDEATQVITLLGDAIPSHGTDRFFVIKVTCTDDMRFEEGQQAIERARNKKNGPRLTRAQTTQIRNKAMDRCVRWITVSRDNIYDILDRLRNIMEEDEPEEWSDQEMTDLLVGTEFLVMNPDERAPQRRQHRDNTGQYFPLLHTYECPLMTAVLARLGVWTHINPNNYVDNCLCLALESAGVNAKVLEDLRAACMLRAIPRRKLKEVADKYNLMIEINTVGTKDIVKVGQAGGFHVKLGLFKRHYFHNFDTPINAWAIKNYDALYASNPHEWWKRDRSLNWVEQADKGIPAIKLLQIICELGNHMVDIDCSTAGVFGTQFHDKASRTFQTLEYPEEAVRLTHPPRFQVEEITDAQKRDLQMAKKKVLRSDRDRLGAKFTKLGMGIQEQIKVMRRHETPEARIFLDFESTTDGESHRAYLGCWGIEGETEVYFTTTDQPGLEFLDWLLDRYGSSVDEDELNTVCIIAHNMTYDASFIMEYLYRLELVERGTSIVCGAAVYRTWDNPAGDWKVGIQFKDSQKMIAGTLASFASKFNLEIKKEVMPYDLYTEEFISNGGWATEDELSYCHDYDELIANLNQFGVKDPDTGKWDMIQYSRWYCQADVRLLREGWRIFRVDTLTQVDLDVNYYPTTASLADAYLTEQGCYDKVMEVSGVVREFISRCNIGGRVMCRWNKRITVEEPLADLDAVSLYPSAMISMPGYLQGPPKVWTPAVNLANVDGYYIKIMIHRVPRKWPFPITRLPTKGDGNNWTNDLEGHEIYVDRPTLEDLCHYSSMGEDELEFTIIQGYYYDEGRNTKINETMRRLFNVRLALKKAKSSAQEGIKLMMNAAYGKCGLKPIDSNVNYISPDKALAFLHNHHNHIKHYVIMPNGTYRYETYKAIDVHYNKQHLSCEILSWSKRLMNQPMCLADEMGIMIYYTDTDSMHIDAHRVDELAVEFKRRYGRDMIGTDIGQFHVDFDFKSCMQLQDGTLKRNEQQAVGEIYASRAIFLGKKSYIDQLSDEAGNVAYHIRLKGIPMKCIVNKCNSEYGGDPMQMYEDMYRGHRVDFYLGEGGHVMFKTSKDHQISSQRMVRSVQFKIEFSDSDSD